MSEQHQHSHRHNQPADRPNKTIEELNKVSEEVFKFIDTQGEFTYQEIMVMLNSMLQYVRIRDVERYLIQQQEKMFREMQLDQLMKSVPQGGGPAESN